MSLSSGVQSTVIVLITRLSVESQLPPSCFAIMLCVIDSTGNIAYSTIALV